MPPESQRRALPVPLAVTSISGRPLPARDKTVAVLPLHNAGPADQAYLAEELTEELIDLLSVSPHLRVRPYPMSATHRDLTTDPARVGREPDVQVLVHASVPRGRVSALAQRYVSVVEELLIPGARFEPRHRQILTGYLDGVEDSLRFTILIHQLVAEVCARFGDRDGAAEHIAAAVDAGLVDRGWLEHCPVLRNVRAQPWFTEARLGVDGRTAAARHLLARSDTPL
jgi:TolB-like protein